MNIIEKIVSFRNYNKNITEKYYCKLEEIPFDKEKEYFGSDINIVRWSYGWGDKGYHYSGKLIKTDKFIGKIKDHLWIFKHPDLDFNKPENMFYDIENSNTRGKLYKLIEVKERI